MKMSKGLLLTIGAMLAIGAILSAACSAPPAPPPPAPPAQAPNQAPVISKVTANPSQIITGKSTTITAVAADPDDDPLTYKWSASQGTIEGTGSQVTFTAPSQSGSINIGLTVSDNRGSQTTGSVTVTVISPTITVTINPTPSESGTVNQYNATDYANFMAGDNAKNVGMRAFWSFDIGSLTDKDIRNATLKYTTGTIVGNPFAYAPPTGLGGLRLWQDNYGMTLPVYGYLGFELINTGLMYSAPTSVDVTTEVRLLTSHGVGRFQTEALFTRASNGDLSPNYIQWSSVVLEVTYAAE